MLLRKWDELPEFMKNNEVKEYYNILNKKKKKNWLNYTLFFFLKIF